MHTLFPFTSLDYRAAEAYLNEQAAQGLRLTGISSLGVAGWERAEEPVRYGTVLMDPSPKTVGDESLTLFRRFVEPCGWRQVACHGVIQVFEGPAGIAPLQTNLEAELALVKRQYWSSGAGAAGIMFALLIMQACLLLGTGTMADFFSSNLLLAAGLLLPLALLGYLASLFRYFRWRRLMKRACQAGEELPPPDVPRARRLGLLRWAACALMALLFGAAMLCDAAHGNNYNIAAVAGWIIGLWLIAWGIELWHRRSYLGGKRRGMLLSFALGAVCLCFTVYAATREPRPLTEADFAGLPIVRSGEVDLELCSLASGKSFLCEGYRYTEFGPPYLRSYYYRAAVPALADRIYGEALRHFHLRFYDGSDMEAVALPGFDQAARGVEGDLLALRRGNTVILLEYDPAHMNEKAALALAEERMPKLPLVLSEKA